MTASETKESRIFNKEDTAIRLTMIGATLAFIIFGFIMDSAKNIFKGLYKIVYEPDYLITDYIGVGGIGAAFVNAGLLTLIIVTILIFMKDVKFTSITIASLLTFMGFSLFGKNLMNVWPILIGVFIYSKVKKEPFAQHVYTAIFASSIAPIITTIAFRENSVTPITLLIAVTMGISVGFFFPQLAVKLVKFHQGFNLYNIGFVSGMVGTVLMFMATSYGFIHKPRLVWTHGNNLSIGILMYGISICFIIIGFLTGKKTIIENIKKLSNTTSRLFGVGYVERFGHSATFVNIGILGIFATTFVILIKGDLNGPVLAGVLTIMGFGSMGKTLKNVLPVVLGIAIGVLTKGSKLNEPSIILSCLFGTGLAPVVGEFGILVGIVLGFLHSAFVLNMGFLNGGYNLYNNGFSIGLMLGFLLPIIETITRKKVPTLGSAEQIKIVDEIERYSSKEEKKSPKIKISESLLNTSSKIETAKKI